ncbi:amino acid adenylation domain-containing protein [Streptomyces sp. NA04227]|nr:amino acid adenylation domain-containing protein [Streptomyces sp. NA04227]
MSAYQHDIWTAEAAAVGDPQFNGVLYQRLSGAVDVAALTESLTRTLKRNDAFSLRFDEEDGIPYQWIETADSEPWVEHLDLSGAEDPAAACAAWREESFVRPFPPRRTRLVVATLLRESPSVLHLHLKTHHLLMDGWSGNEIDRQLWEEYARLTAAAGSAPAEPPAPPSVRTLVEDDAAYRASADHARDRAFHRDYLAGASPALFARSGAEHPGGARRARHSFTVDGELVRRVRAQGSSPFAYLAAVFATYLARVHSRPEVVLGVPFLNRRGAAQLSIAGQRANNLPLRVAVPPEATLAELAAEVRRDTDRLHQHERLPLGEVLGSLAPDQAGSRRLFDVTLSYLRYPPREAPEGLDRETVFMAPLHEGSALAVVIWAFGDGGDLRVDFDYATEIFDEDLPIASVSAHLLNLLRNGVEQPERPALTVPMLDEAEYAALVHGGQDAPVAYPAEKTLHQLVAEQAARTPHRTAVTGARGDALSYAELDAAANQVARALRARGVGVGSRVAVLMDRSPRLIVALLGVLKAGGAYVPVDPGYPADRIRFVLRDSGAPVALTDRGTVLPETEADDVGEVGEVSVLAVEDCLTGPDGPLEPLATGSDLAYVIYTSGSTGRPKGVMVEHHSVVNRLAWMQRRYPVGEGDTLLQKTPISFDVSVWELFWWAIEGASLTLLPPGAQRDPGDIARAIAEQAVTTVHFVPSMLAPFLDLLDASAEARAQVASLRQVFCSGEALPPARVEQFNRVFADGPGPAPRLVNLYGPTEAAVDVSYHDCPTDPSQPVRRVPIGRPVDNTRLYVLDPQGNLQPPGVPGELCIGGVQVARGYLGRPELTEERFGPDPFAGSGRLYRTGDLARRLADGDLEYLGRIDGQVKIRGNRVELGEVQNRLASVPGVRDAVVTDHRSPTRGTFLTGYYVSADTLDPARLRAELASVLPEFMLPAYFVRIDAVPLTPNGKADRRALPAPVAASGRGDGAPRDATEALLAGIWAEVLEVERVGVHDDYYALGGDSLTMLRIRARAEQAGVHFSLGDLVRHPTVAEVAARSTATAPADAADSAPLAPFTLISSVDRGRLEGREDAHPLTRLQLGLLYHSRAQEDSAVYHDVFQYSLALDWDESAFRTAFDRLVARHPVLRSSFDLGGHSEPLQIVHTEVTDGLGITDLRDRDEEAARAEIRAHVDERRFHHYDFARAPLHRFQVYVLADSVELVLSFHHAILDGGSVAHLIQELLQDHLHARGLDVAAVTDPAAPSAAHHVRAERQALESAPTREFWRELLAGAPRLRLAGFRPHEDVRPPEQITRLIGIPDELVHAAREFANERALPLKSVLFAAHCLTLRHFTGIEDVTTGLVAHGRPEVQDADRTAGLFLNTLPLRLNTARSSWAEVAREAFRLERESHPHKRYPLSAVQEDLGRTVVDTAFNYVHFRQLTAVLALPGVRLLDFRTWEETNFQLLVNAVVDPRDGALRLRMDHHGETFTHAQAELYGDRFTAILERLVQHADEAPDFGFLTPTDGQPGRATAGAEPQDILTTRTGAEPQDVVTAVAAQTARTPEARALAFGEEHWTYAELGRASDRVAAALLARGARSGDRVGIAMERSPETVAVTLGVLKAGAAAVPLDVAYPAERLAAMVEQARPHSVIAHAAHIAPLGQGAPVLLAEEALGGAEASGPLPAISPTDTAYVLFTSGSTGRPKGVAMPHRSLSQLIDWQNGIPSGVPGGATAQFAPLSFDVSFQEIFATLGSGGTLHVLTEEQRRDLPGLLRLLERERVQRIYLPYVALQQLAETAAALDLAPSGLKAVISSGEQLRVTDEIRALCAASPGVILENQYGPTESHVVASYTMSGDPALFPALPPIGTAVDGSRLLILDEELRPVPTGVKGELYLAGDCLADGYIGQPELTAERFVEHPLGRLYRTGDLAFALPGGDVVCLGRADSQVKVRGYRVEPAEVELAVTRFAAMHPGLSEAAVVARRRESNDSFLAAFLVGDPAGADLTLLGKQLRTVLPDYLVPSHFEWLDALPLTPSGKRDDAALRRFPLTTAAATEATAPRDAYERTLAEVICDLLELPSLGVHDNIFELGCTSLTAMRLVVILEQRYGAALPLSEFVSAPTVAQLARRLRSGGATTAFDPLVPLRTKGSRRPLFLVHPMGGNVLCYVPFAKYLHEDQPFYAFQAAGGDHGTEPLTTLEDIAASYVAAMRRAQPSGPYTIGGWSFGGFVAFEMARQLRAAGEKAERVILLDTVALKFGTHKRTDDDALLGWFFWELLWLQRGGDSPMEVIPAELDTLEDKFEFIARLAVDEGVLPAGSTGAVVRRLFRVYEANWRATAAYRPDVVDQDLVLLHASEPLPAVLDAMHSHAESLHQDPANGWGALTAGELTVVDVPGDHLTIMEEPHIAHLVKAVTELIGH